MSTILAIETSTEIASAALLYNSPTSGPQLLFESASGVQNHSHTLLPMVQRLLALANLRLDACSAIAFGLGPGSFTGVRTACGVAQGLAFGAGLPVLPVSTLLAMAEACRLQTGANEVVPILDARMGEVYWAQYRFNGSAAEQVDGLGGWQTIVSPCLTTPAQVMPLIAQQGQYGHEQVQIQTCGNGVPICAISSTSAWLVDGLPEIMPLATQIAQLGKVAFEAGLGLLAEAAQPLYLRNKVAKTIAERALEAGGQR
jgi:tRNA threonylcarbamoyladenosine biosynthesis protein TsaB